MTVAIDYELGTPLDQLPAETPFQTGSGILRLLHIVASLEQSSDTQPPRKVDWRVADPVGRRASLRSFTNPDLASVAGRSLIHGFRSAEADERLPNVWNFEAGKVAATIAGRLGDTADTGLRLIVSSDGADESAEVTRQASRNLKLATALRFTSYGSVVGTLGRITAYHGSRRATLWSDLDNRRIDVRFRPEHIEDVRDAWARAHVEVTGLIHENPSGQVLRIDADALDIRKDEQRASLTEALPRGFYPNITGGLSAHEYLRTIRGE